MRTYSVIGLIVLLLLCTVLLSACGGGGEETTPPTGQTGTTASDTTAPETTAPETTAPETTAPETTVPETTEPGTTVPDSTAPDTTPGTTTDEGGGFPIDPETARRILEAFQKPDPDLWAILPEALRKENMAVTAAPDLDFSQGVAVSALPGKFVGKQLNAVYTVAGYLDTALAGLGTFFAYADEIADLYQSFINENPTDYAVFTATYGNFRFRIATEGDTYRLYVSYDPVCMELSVSQNGETYSGRVQLTDSNAIRFESDGDSLKAALDLSGFLTLQVEMVRQGDVTVGYVYERESVAGVALTTSTYFYSDEDFTTLVGTKGDFINPADKGNRNVEVYDSQTGAYVGAEVRELVAKVRYDTLWFNLADIAGLTSVRRVEESNGSNADTVFINGSASAFVPRYNTILGVKTSRQYDIEFKTVYVLVYDEANDSYETVKTEIPMLFVQRDNLDSYLADIEELNGVTLVNTQTAAEAGAVSVGFTVHLEVYETIKELVTPEQIVAYIGTRDAFFDMP